MNFQPTNRVPRVFGAYPLVAVQFATPVPFVQVQSPHLANNVAVSVVKVLFTVVPLALITWVPPEYLVV